MVPTQLNKASPEEMVPAQLNKASPEPVTV
jgi:hypothetical protein